MSFDNKYPYTDFHELNLDWVLEKIKGIDDHFTSIQEQIDNITLQIGDLVTRINGVESEIIYIKNNFPAMLAPEYDDSGDTSYDLYSIVRDNDKIYIADKGLVPVTGGGLNPLYWSETTLAEPLADLLYKYNEITVPDLQNVNMVIAEHTTDLDDLWHSLAKDWDDSTQYELNDHVIHDYDDKNALFRCIVSNATVGTFVPAEWILADLGTVISSNDADIRRIKESKIDWSGTMLVGNTTTINVITTDITDWCIDAYASIYGISPTSITVTKLSPDYPHCRVDVVWPAQAVDFDYVIRFTKNGHDY